MKTYKVKNYKGNLVESLSKFQKSHKGMKIVEACEDGDDLKIKAEESEKLEEAAGKKVYIVELDFEEHDIDVPEAVFTTLAAAKKWIKNNSQGQPEDFIIFEFVLDAFDEDGDHFKRVWPTK